MNDHTRRSGAREPAATTRDRRLGWMEAPRALAELASLVPAAPYLALAPRGDGHPVLVLPGYGGGDLSTAVLRRYLSDLGFAAMPWGLGRNLGPSMPDLGRRLGERLDEAWRDGRKRRVSLVGWSLGGVYARLLAQRRPDHVRQVITLGSPIGGRPPRSAALTAIQRLSGGEVDRERAAALRAQAADALPDVPGSAVFSRTDGVVPWQIARQTPSPIAENIEVYGSHLGLGVNPAVLFLVAERLAQPEHAWRRFERRGWRRLVYGAVD